MRPVSFVGLLRILQLAAEYPGGLGPGDLDAQIKKRALLLTKKGSAPARATLYHHRNTLIHLGALMRHGRKLRVNSGDPHVETLLSSPILGGPQLDPGARDAFSELVLRNPDCKERFFDLFVPIRTLGSYGVRQFRSVGCPVLWGRVPRPEARAEVLLRTECKDRAVSLRSPSEVKGVLYGLRYWARDELALVDEFFREGRGSVLYPLLPPETSPSARDMVGEILAAAHWENEWATLSVRELIGELCERRRRPLKSLFDAIRVMERQYPRYVMLVPTSSSFATLTARSVAREEFELRGYYQDDKGRYISHLNIHESIGRRRHASAS